MNNRVTILCSGFGLGFYVPGLLLEAKLHALGLQAEIEVFETLMPDAKKEQTDNSRRAYQQSFAVALTSQKIPSDIRSSLDEAAVEQLLQQWQQEERQRFIVLSGHWVHVMDKYRAVAGFPVEAELLYIDAELSPSWKNLRKVKPAYAEGYREVHMYDLTNRGILYRIDAGPEEPLPVSARNGRLVMHGGGWGIGTFREKFAALEAAGYKLDIAAYSTEEIGPAIQGRRYYMNDPQWRTWKRDGSGQYTFPPFAEVTGNGENRFPPCEHYAEGMFGVIRQASAVISKPGGGALIDSLASGTPLVLLDPFGPHEQINSDLWVELGYGIRYGEWAATGFDPAALRRIADNLESARGKYPDYAVSYAEQLSAAEGRS
ncbi:UDP-glucuronosyltransferase [Paenibacillus piscarius]|uniref:UDP-glucuronosyltransferase n=1 Tax=Paenibacillus piscarius TaxID=1089681 RepID=UPI001EE92AB0|nr:UDP-glucuronosyltransferase [Paenibacillus piscarius]